MSEMDSLFEELWYHSIELLPGKFTKGHDHTNVAVTRTLLRGCEIEEYYD